MKYTKVCDIKSMHLSCYGPPEKIHRSVASQPQGEVDLLEQEKTMHAIMDDCNM